jgi:Uma2 family endonuclease
MPVAETARAWTLDDLYALPDDGNKYELIRGELFVTPAPSTGHETVLARLTRILDPYVVANDLGFVFHPRAALRFEGSEAEPDLMVRRRESPDQDWETMPPPSLLVEVLSPSTRRRDRKEKPDFYLDAGVADYWIVDPETKTITSIRRGEADALHRKMVRWWPKGAAEPIDVVLTELFGA